MRENLLFCVAVDQIAAHDYWVSVVALGRYLEFSDSRKDAKGGEYARSRIERRALWWQSGVAQFRIAATANLWSRCSIIFRSKGWFGGRCAHPSSRHSHAYLNLRRRRCDFAEIPEQQRGALERMKVWLE